MRRVAIVVGIVGGIGFALWHRRPVATSSQVTRDATVSSRTSSPALVVNQGRRPQRELAFTDPSYDPVRWAHEDDLTAKELYRREPRDPELAPKFERRMTSTYKTAFGPLEVDDKVQQISASCKTLTWMTEIVVANADADQVYRRINGLVLGSIHAPSLDPGDDPDTSKIVFYTAFEPAWREDHVFDDFVANDFPRLVKGFRAEYVELRDR